MNNIVAITKAFHDSFILFFAQVLEQKGVVRCVTPIELRAPFWVAVNKDVVADNNKTKIDVWIQIIRSSS